MANVIDTMDSVKIMRNDHVTVGRVSEFKKRDVSVMKSDDIEMTVKDDISVQVILTKQMTDLNIHLNFFLAIFLIYLLLF